MCQNIDIRFLLFYCLLILAFFFLFIHPLPPFLCFSFFYWLFTRFLFDFLLPFFFPLPFLLCFCLCFLAPMGFISSLTQLAWD
jgi:hypothetical protein